MDAGKIAEARKAYEERLANGWTAEEAIRNTRQEFDLNEHEEAKLLKNEKPS